MVVIAGAVGRNDAGSFVHAPVGDEAVGDASDKDFDGSDAGKAIDIDLWDEMQEKQPAKSVEKKEIRRIERIEWGMRFVHEILRDHMYCNNKICFSLEKLVFFARALGQHVEIKLKPSKNRSTGRLTMTG